MRTTTQPIIALALMASFVAVPSLGRASDITLERDTVVPVVIENDLTLRRLQVGDRFTAHVDGDRDLPAHTRLIGRVYRVLENRRHDVSVDLEFTDVILPDGSRHRLDAVPVSLDDKYVTHREDGRIVVKDDYRERRDYVAEGAIGGFVIGSMVHRRFAGTIIGALVGAIAADNDREHEDTILHKGQRVGALIERDTKLDFYPGNRAGRFDRGRDVIPPVGADNAGRTGDPLPPDRGATDRVPVADNARDIALNYEGKDLQFDATAKPFKIGDIVMVPLQLTATQIGLTVDRGKDTVVYVEDDDSSLRLELDSADARLNGRKVTLASPLQDRGGVLYIPVDVLASMKKGAFLLNGTKIKPVDSGDGNGN